MKNNLLAIGMLIICASNVWAQQTNPDSGIQHLKRMIDQYKKKSQLSFNMDFRYAKETAPDVYIDSMSGSAKIHGEYYSYKMGNTDLIRTSTYQISIFSEEKIMQLIRLNKSDSSSPMESAGISSSLINALDSMQQQKKLTITSTENPDHYIVTIQFSDHPSWKKVEYLIRKKDALIESTSIVAKMEDMLGPGLQGMDLVDGYAIITTSFSAYDTRIPDAEIFRNEKYFTQNGHKFEPLAPYSDYRVMLIQ